MDKITATKDAEEILDNTYFDYQEVLDLAEEILEGAKNENRRIPVKK